MNNIRDYIEERGDQIGNKDEKFHSPEAEYFPTTHLEIQEPRVYFDGDDFFISWGQNEIKLKNKKSVLRKFSHEFLYCSCSGKSDSLLSEIGVTDPVLKKLTPDYINSESRIVVELATVNSSEENDLFRSYKRKIDHYEYILNSMPVSYYILVVGLSGCLSNLTLGQESVNAWCSKLRIAKIIEYKIKLLLAYDPFHDPEYSELTGHIEDVLRNIRYDPEKQKTRDFKDIEDPFTPENYKLFQESQADPEIVKKILKQTFEDAKKINPLDRDPIEKYLNRFNDGNSQCSQKRVCNFPFVFVPRNVSLDPNQEVFSDVNPEFNIDVPEEIIKLWRESAITSASHTPVSELDSLLEAEKEWVEPLAGKKTQKSSHKAKEASCFKAQTLNTLDWLNLAEKGIHGKSYKDDPLLVASRYQKKKSFSPQSSTEDIEKFIYRKTLLEDSKKNSHNLLLDLLNNTKQSINGSSKNKKLGSVDVFRKWIVSNKLIQFADMVSCISQELAISFKHNIPDHSFIIKTLKHHRISMIVKPTSSRGHIFASLCIRKENGVEVLDTGRLGPSLYETKNYYITDFMSFNEVTLEHFVKSGPYMASLTAHLLSFCGINIFDKDPESFLRNEDECQYTKNFWIYLKSILLIYLNNKHGAEELITSHRYLIMSCLNEVDPSPFPFASKLPLVLRSRLEVFLLKRVILMMDKLSLTPIGKHIVHGRPGTGMEHTNIPSLFLNGNVTLEQKVNEFYFGYAVSKVKGRGHDASFGITKKLMDFEYEFRDQFAKEKKKPIVVMSDEQVYHGYNYHIQSYFIQRAKQNLKSQYGPEFMSMIKDEILRNYSYATFNELGTLKASAHDMSALGTIEIDPDRLTRSVQELRQLLKETYPNIINRRPKVIESLSKLCSVYESQGKGRTLTHVFELVPYCLDAMEQVGTFNVDLFSKPQHGGIREIYVLEISARVVQYFLELISRVLCSKFQSETISHPNNKHYLILQHHNSGYVKFEDFCSINKSGDASKWSQLHTGVKFAHLLIGMTDELFHGLIFRLMRLWMSKRIMLPVELCLSFLKNQDVTDSDETWLKLRDDFISGKGPFEEPFNPMMLIHSGMMQGVPHLTSSLEHTILQEGCRELIISHGMNIHGLELIVTVQQGSDESDIMLGISASKLSSHIKLLRTYHIWKDNIGKYLSIKPSVEKTTNGALDVVEYNSEWYIRNKLVRPTFRWVSACLETALVENFVSRYQIYSNQLTSCLEGGASTFECALIQLCQAWMHYKMLGLDIHILFSSFSLALMRNPDPSIGFFPLELDVCAGLPGLDFQFYMLCKMTRYGSYLKSLCNNNERIPNPIAENRATLMSSLSGYNIGFSNLNIWKSVIRRVKLGELQDAIDVVEENPELIYKLNESWQDDKYKLLLKLFTGGVKASLSNFQPCFRMMVASVYMLSRPCFIDNTVERYTRAQKKMSLFSCLKDYSDLSSPILDKDLESIFPYKNQYDQLLENCHEFQDNVFVVPTNMVRKSKISIQILESHLSDQYPIVDVVRKKWFSHQTIRTGDTHFNLIWDLYKSKYSFLRDYHDETKEVLGLNAIELKTYLEKVVVKGRQVTLTDTVARYRKSFLDILSRIYWPGMQLRGVYQNKMLGQLQELKSLRSNIFCLSTLPFTKTFKTAIAEDLIKRSRCLSGEISSFPKKFVTLKLAHDMLNGISKLEILEALRFAKEGTLGYFTRRQVQNSSGEYIGRGTWQGVIFNIECKLEILDRELTSVIVNKLHNLDELAQGLSVLCKDFGINVDKNNQFLSKYVFTGKTIASSSSMGCSLIVEDEQSFFDFNRLISSGWCIELKESLLRLCITSLEYSQDRQLTISSDSYNSMDFDPTSDIKIKIPQKQLESPVKKWFNMQEMTTVDFDNLFSPARWKKTRGQKKQQHQSKEDDSISFLSLELLQDFLLTYLFDQRSKDSSKTIEEKQEDLVSTIITDSEITDLLMTMYSADEVDNWELTEEEFQASALRDDGLELSNEKKKEILDMFYEELSKSDEYRNEYLDQLRGRFKSMTSEHPFFNRIKKDLELCLGCKDMNSCYRKLLTSLPGSITLPEPYSSILRGVFSFRSLSVGKRLADEGLLSLASTSKQKAFMRLEEMTQEELVNELEYLKSQSDTIKTTIATLQDPLSKVILQKSVQDIDEQSEYTSLLLMQGSFNRDHQNVPPEFIQAPCFKNTVGGVFMFCRRVSELIDNQFSNMYLSSPNKDEFLRSSLLVTAYQNQKTLLTSFPERSFNNLQEQLFQESNILPLLLIAAKLLDFRIVSKSFNSETILNVDGSWSLKMYLTPDLIYYIEEQSDESSS